MKLWKRNRYWKQYSILCEDSLCLEALELFLLLADGSLEVQISAVVTIFIELERCVIELWHEKWKRFSLKFIGREIGNNRLEYNRISKMSKLFLITFEIYEHN